MAPTLHTVSIPIEAPYYTLGTLNKSTRSIWIICHGIGQRAPFFMRKFEGLLASDQFLIAPQGLSRYYLQGQYERVGASWMTREYREMEIRNQWVYLDTLLAKELGDSPGERYEINLLGFSQGVATIARWAIAKRIPFQKLVLWAGGFPHEMQEDLTHTLSPHSEVWAVYGDEDPYLTEKKIADELSRLQLLFGGHLKSHIFPGVHELKREVLQTLFFTH